MRRDVAVSYIPRPNLPLLLLRVPICKNNKSSSRSSTKISLMLEIGSFIFWRFGRFESNIYLQPKKRIKYCGPGESNCLTYLSNRGNPRLTTRGSWKRHKQPQSGESLPSNAFLRLRPSSMCIQAWPRCLFCIAQA